MLVESQDVVVLTGAGVSTESGIPDFRSPGIGLWTRIRPMELFAQSVLHHNPIKFWKQAEPVFREMAGAKPNPCHVSLARMESLGLIRGVITQNIDSLHQQAGANVVLEVHGHLRTARCPGCGTQTDLISVLDRVVAGDNPPRCSCGEVLRPDVVLFGDPLPQVFQAAWRWARMCDLMIVVGSSLEVAPVCWLVPEARKLAIINVGETQCDDLADVLIRDMAGKVLTELADETEKLKGGII
jgi:NAD-dependent deacetylase